MTRRHTQSALLALLLVAVTFAAYRPAWHGDFIWDDDAYVTNNELLTAPDGLRRIWFSFDSPSQYFPLTYTTFRLERALFGLNPTPYHLTNIALHAANALLVWWLLKRLRVPGAALAGALFALHPVQVESVAWITERKNVLMGFFFLLTLLAWTRFIEPTRRSPWRFYVMALCFYALALAAKTTACTLPAASLAILWWQRERITAARLWQIAPFVAVGLAMGSLTVWWERFHQGTRGVGFAMPFLERVLLVARNLWFYAFKAVWPDKLTFIYPRWTLPPNEWPSYGWLVALLLATAAIYLARRRLGRGTEIAAFWFVASLSPLLGLIMLYTFRYTFVADHYQYLAVIAPLALIAAAVMRMPRALGLSAAAAILATLGFLTWRQSATYANRETLWRTTIARNPACWMAHNNLGLELGLQHRPNESIAQFQQALALHPDGPEADYNLANTLNEMGAPDQALTHATRAVSLKPTDAEAHISVGNSLFRLHRDAAALSEYDTALQLWPGNVDAEYNRAVLLLRMGNIEATIAGFESLLSRREYGQARTLLGTALLAERRYRDAIMQLSSSVAHDRSDLTGLTTLAWVLATAPDAGLRDGARALELARTAAGLAPNDDPVVLRTLAAAHAETGAYTAARDAAERALLLARDAGQTDLCVALESELAAYEADQPYHER